jgi:hypothetical protein
MVFAFCVVLQLPIPFYHFILGRTNWCEGFGRIFVQLVHSTIYKLQFHRACMGRPIVSRAFRLRFFSCVFLQSFTSFFSSKRDIYLTIRPIPKASDVCFVISFLFRPKTVFSSENSRAFCHSILKRVFFIEKNARYVFSV